MSKRTQKVALALVIISLLTIGAVLSSGLLKNQKTTQNQTEGKGLNVLGEVAQSQIIPSLSSNMNKLVENTLQNTKELVSEKTVEVKTNIMQTLEKEVNNFTQSQVESIKMQICREWGVVQITPSKSP
ncbi:hypothetical protein A2960_05110 [Candidatus Gottesmanbacteria bacterium RIFCSPLOWO2_01_FULL_39_12b]|uniref:Uncharacterized protein n=1 Tax=Candidatus Gottesmanbacteria bacterium RIFCSPLOWO2_01_FULL_39_12b TaxID=1798388 RepID=A0A1F6ALZ8_9BACT|nr:MAG: hypothetical protein A2960_05110 [Candidatus Gottesmanbacteria bacterium RIFCSPLOWO2_01_FULL_39_12b]